MARILAATNGTLFLRPSVPLLRAAGHRVTLRDSVTPHDLERFAPDLLIVAMHDVEAMRAMLHDLQAEIGVRLPPVIVAGASWDLASLLPTAPLMDLLLLSAPLDPLVLRDAAHMFVPTQLPLPRLVASAQAIA